MLTPERSVVRAKAAGGPEATAHWPPILFTLNQHRTRVLPAAGMARADRTLYAERVGEAGGA